MKSPFFILLFILLSESSLIAQDNTYFLSIQPKLPNVINSVKIEFKDTLKLNNEVLYFENKLRAAGYINFKKIQDTTIANVRNLLYNYGEVWTWGLVKLGDNLVDLLPKSELKNSIKPDRVIQVDLLSVAIEEVLTYAEEHGYPFAEVKFDSIQIVNNKVNAQLNLILNPLIEFDTLTIIDKNIIKPSFLSSYIGIKYGDVYNEKKIIAIQNRIDELGFIRLKYPPKVYFANNTANVVLNPEKRNANKFDGLIGVQPNANNQKTAIVGQAQLYLVNLLGRGEKASIDFKSQANETRDLKIMLNYPFVFSTSFGLTANLDIRRQDTSFSILGRAIAIQYLLKGNNQLSLVYRVNESNLLSVKKYTNTNVLPENLDVDKKSYGITTLFEELDYRINPKKGYNITSSALFGTRKITKNEGIADTLYEGINLINTQIQLSLGVKKYFNLIGKHVVLLSYKTEWIDSEKLFNNELLRIGGINDLRGFDEESIFTSYYWISTFEYRFLLDRNSFFRLFYDQAYYVNKVLNTKDYPFGIGAGVQIQTIAGMLQLNYALGAQANSGINFQTGKVHFGIINYF
jgi:hypothetical protein